VPDDCNPYKYRGFQKYLLGNYNGALRDYNLYLAKSKDTNTYYRTLQDHKRKFGDDDSALFYINKQLSLKPGDAELIFERGNLKLSKKDSLGAKKDFKDAIKKDTGKYNRLIHQADYCYSFDDFKGAKKYAAKAMKLDTANFPAYYVSALAKAQLKDSAGAVKDMEKAFMLGYCSIAGLASKAEVMSILKDYKNAVKTLDYVLQKAPGMLSGYLLRAHAKLESGDRTGACEDYKKLKELGYIGVDEELEKNCQSSDR